MLPSPSLLWCPDAALVPGPGPPASSVCLVVLVPVVALPMAVGRAFSHQFVKSFDRLGE